MAAAAAAAAANVSAAAAAVAVAAAADVVGGVITFWLGSHPFPFKNLQDS